MFAGIGLAIVGFIVVIVVCAVILALLAAILPSYEGRTRAEQREIAAARAASGGGDAPPDHPTPADPEVAGADTPATEVGPSAAPDGESDPAA